jgi:hypothetical protein
MLFISRTPQIPENQYFRKILSYPITHWIYLGEDSTWRIQAEAALSPTIKRISIADLLDQQSLALRQPYIDWIGELSQKNTSLEWWASEISAKNPYYHLFFRICLLASAKQLLLKTLKKNILIICSSPEILHQIIIVAEENGIEYKTLSHTMTSDIRTTICRSALQTAKEIAGLLPPLESVARISGHYQKYLETNLRYRKKILSKYHLDTPEKFSGDKTILFFTWVDRRSFANDHTYLDPYFGPLPKIFKNRGYQIAFIPQVLFTIPFEEAVQKLVQTGETIFFPELFLSMADSKDRRNRMNAFNPTIPTLDTVGGIPVYDLAKEHISQTRHLLFETLRFEPVIQNMEKQGITPCEIIHTCEGHSWEQALSWCVHQYMPGTKVLGYDNVTFSRMVLSMYPANNEIGLRPLPDRIVTNGPLFYKTLLREGFPSGIVRSGCAIRHTYLWESSPGIKNTPIQEKTGPVRILVATAIGLGDSVELAEKAVVAFGGDPRFILQIKCHPLVNPDEVRKYLGRAGEHSNISFETTSVGELLRSADILFYTYTSVCYEALRYGVKPVCVRSENFLNLDKLDATPEIRWIATTPDSLRSVVNEIMTTTTEKNAQWHTDAQQIVREALAPVTDNGMDAFLFT